MVVSLSVCSVSLVSFPVDVIEFAHLIIAPICHCHYAMHLLLLSTYQEFSASIPVHSCCRVLWLIESSLLLWMAKKRKTDRQTIIGRRILLSNRSSSFIPFVQRGSEQTDGHSVCCTLAGRVCAASTMIR